MTAELLQAIPAIGIWQLVWMLLIYVSLEEPQIAQPLAARDLRLVKRGANTWRYE